MSYAFCDKKRIITTERLSLRPFELSDAERVAELANNCNITKNLYGLPYPYDIDCAIKWISTHKEKFDGDKVYEFAITSKAIGELFGSICLYNKQSGKIGEIGYWVGEQYWGNGYATEAAKAILKFAFDKGFHKVCAGHLASNPASGKVIQKLGMELEAAQKDQRYIERENRYETLMVYGIINKTGGV